MTLYDSEIAERYPEITVPVLSCTTYTESYTKSYTESYTESYPESYNVLC